MRTYNRTKERQAATIQLIAGDDDDLIEWLRSLPKGQVNNALKTMLRAALHDGVEYQPVEPINSELVAKVADLEHEISERDAQLDELQREFQTVLGQLNKFADTLPSYVAQLVASHTGHIDAAPIEIEPQERVPDEVLERRKENRKQNQW